MMIFKISGRILQGVLDNQMYAICGKPRGTQENELILVSQTKTTLKKGEKPIRWVMNFVSCEEDEENLSEKIWGRKWRYLLKCKNLRSVEPFDINEIRISHRDYNGTQTYGYVDKEDEDVILDWIGESDIEKDESQFKEFVLLFESFEEFKDLDLDERIKRLDIENSSEVEFKNFVSRTIKRPSALSKAIKEKHDSICSICGYPGFRKKGGGKYAEVHHMHELNNLAPKTLQSWNLIVVCPTCHKRLHYGNVDYEFLDPGWKIVIDGREYVIK